MTRTVTHRPGAAPADLPRWIRPQLTQLVDQAPEGDQWLHEIKYDGYRMHARLDLGAVKLLTRTGLDWTHKRAALLAQYPRCAVNPVLFIQLFPAAGPAG
jgi:ATP-dependent DNA ligase